MARAEHTWCVERVLPIRVLLTEKDGIVLVGNIFYRSLSLQRNCHRILSETANIMSTVYTVSAMLLCGAITPLVII